MKNELEYLSYGLDTSKKLLYSKWAMRVESPQYRQGLQRLVKVIHDNEVELWIHESVRLNDMDIDDVKWTTEVLALILSQTRLKHIAIVRPQGSTSNVHGNSIREKAYRIYGKNVGVEFFDTVEEAKAWILPQLQHYKLPNLSTPVKPD